LVLIYDLIEDRCIDDVIITNISQNIFRIYIIFYVTGRKIRYEKSLLETVNRYEKQEQERKSRFFLEIDSQSAVEGD